MTISNWIHQCKTVLQIWRVFHQVPEGISYPNWQQESLIAVGHVSWLRACGPVIPGILSLQPELVRPWYMAGRHGSRSITVMNTISLLLLGRHALTSPEGGGACSLGTFDYGVVGHLAFRLS